MPRQPTSRRAGSLEGCGRPARELRKAARAGTTFAVRRALRPILAVTLPAAGVRRSLPPAPRPGRRRGALLQRRQTGGTGRRACVAHGRARARFAGWCVRQRHPPRRPLRRAREPAPLGVAERCGAWGRTGYAAIPAAVDGRDGERGDAAPAYPDARPGFSCPWPARRGWPAAPPWRSGRAATGWARGRGWPGPTRQHDLEPPGPLLRNHPALGEGGANVNFVQARGRRALRALVERGLEGETLSCGSRRRCRGSGGGRRALDRGAGQRAHGIGTGPAGQNSLRAPTGPRGSRPRRSAETREGTGHRSRLCAADDVRGPFAVSHVHLQTGGMGGL